MSFTAIKKDLLGIKKEKHLSTFLFALLAAALVFIPFIIYDNGYFLFYGDFNVQQIPFYQQCHAAIRSGNWGWNWNTDLGVNFIGSYTFYTLGSPFFWLTLPFPNAWVPYLMGPLLILKFACSALTAYCFIRRFTRTPEAARLGALIYAFSGFSVYNIFFNHFHEAIVFFPLLLLSVELLITENRRGFFAAMVAITAITNYFFFFGMVVFTIIYWLVRVFSGCYTLRFSRFLWFVFEAVLGLLIAAAILIPTCYAVLANSRISEISVGWNAIMYGKEQIYLNIFECFFFPPDIPARPVFFPDADVKWSSLGGWLPLFSMVGVFAFMQQKKRTWQRRLMGISIFMALVPILNSAFYMFNAAYYARWYYMPILIMSLMTVQCTEDTEIHFKSPYKWVTGITVAATLVFAFFPREVENGEVTKWGLYTNDESFYIYRFIATAAIAIVSLVVLGMLLMIIKKHRKQFFKTATVMVIIISVIYSIYFIGTGKSHSYSSDIMINDLIESDITLPGDKDTYRIDVYDGVDNTGMFLDYQTINAFHSVVPTSVTDFWEYVGEDRGVASRPTTESYATRSLLSVKYLLVREDGESFTDELGQPKMPGFEFFSHENGYDVYVNNNYLPMGFTYDYYMTTDQADEISEKQRSNAMLKALILNDEQVKKYGKWFTNISDFTTKQVEDEEPTQTETVESEVTQTQSSEDVATSTQSDTATPTENYEVEVQTEFSGDALDYFYYTADEVVADTAALRQNGIMGFEKTNDGFTAEITAEKDTLVFFSVPYEQGWTATVNGVEVAVEKVNVGFMAVPAAKGHNTITFTYQTPGLALGVKISVAAIALWFIYTIISLVLTKKGKMAVTFYPEGEKLMDKWKADIAAELLLEANETREEQDYFDIELTDNDLYGQNEEIGFSRGFWIKTDEDETPLNNEEE